MVRKFLGWTATALAVLAFGPSQAHASFVWFVLNNANVPGMQVAVAEQIVCITPGNCNAGNPNRVLDYQFYVFNTGAFPVDGFSLGVGSRNAALGVAGANLNYSDLAGGADGVFPAAAGGGLTGNAIGFLTQPAVNPALVTSQAPGMGATAFIAGGGSADISDAGGGAWGFEEFDNFTNAGAPPAQNAYVVRWYTALQGGAGRPALYNAGCTGNIPTANVPGTPLANGAAGAAGVANDGVINTSVVCGGVPYFGDARFDLFSSKSPVSGTGAPDPSGAWELSFDDDVNGTDTTFDFTNVGADDQICITDCEGAPTQAELDAAVPEPAVQALIGGGLILLAFLRRRARA